MLRSLSALSGLVLIAACVQTDGTANRTEGQMVTITPAMRAEIERQGHDPDEEICKRVEDTGSTIPRKVCATRVAWEAQSQAARQATEETQRRGLIGTTQGEGQGG